ncbi:MAG TPA: hypothetical protein VLE70_20140 [Anaerolineae bacterium]|jgi:hypothetical protein|nr:hypothetical protein [Anaerolineae bacterium]
MDAFIAGGYPSGYLRDHGRHVGRGSSKRNEGHGGKAVEKQSAPPAAQELVNALVSDLKEKSENKESVAAPEVKEGEDAREVMLQGLQKAAHVLDAKCSPEEATGFKLWLLDIAEAVAEADKEGSHFGIGGVRVTDKEKAALSEIRSTLGLQE